MADIITIDVGQAAMRIGQHFWNNLHLEHQIQTQQPCGLMTFFQHTQKTRKSRAIFVTQDQRSADMLRVNSRDLHQQTNIISKQSPNNANFASSFYLAYSEISQRAEDSMRKTIEHCDHFSGFILNSSLDGSTASGIGSSLQRVTQEFYADKSCHSYKLVPNLQAANPIQIYNSVFALNVDIYHSNLSYLYENSAVHYQIARQGEYCPSMNQINKWIGSALSQLSVPLRFAGPLNTNQRKIATNLVFFPRMHYATFSVSLLASRDPLLSALSPDSFLLKNYFGYNPDLTTFGIYANVSDSRISEFQISRTICSEFERMGFPFSSWIKNNIHLSMTQKRQGSKRAGVAVHSYHINRVFKSLSKQFALSFRRKAFIHYYLAAGMDQMEFTQAESNLNDLNCEYDQGFESPPDIEGEEYVEE